MQVGKPRECCNKYSEKNEINNQSENEKLNKTGIITLVLNII